ncbi:MAG: PadR family transcriptional regulator [Coriobacteriales bacterium]|jgi:PadR family transcriptional regulator PadR|nr:PadR family transcriptional regulator [Coriobacteriales bacterium]
MSFPIAARLLDACVLSVLGQADAYGYELTQNLQGSLGVSESTLYPVLRRLQSGGFLRTYDVPHQGRNRRYYSITGDGKAQLAQHRSEWTLYRNRIDAYLGSEA